MNNHYLVSIGMPVYNCAGTVQQAIRSILNQTFEDWELLIIDDGSTDDTLKIIAAFNDHRVVVFEGKENKGTSNSPERVRRKGARQIPRAHGWRRYRLS